MRKWKTVSREKEIFLKNFRATYWENFGSLPTVRELTSVSLRLPRTKQKGVICE